MSTLIVTGGHIDITAMKEYLAGKSFRQVIAVDGAAACMEELGIAADLLVGDFDTLPPEALADFEKKNIPIRRFCPEKDDTDTQIAIEMAIEQERGRKDAEVLILGATGTRLDHTLANLFLLNLFALEGIPAYCVDAYNRISVHRESFAVSKSEQYGRFVSFLALTPTVEKITLTGFRYPLVKHTLRQDESLCISNEIVEEAAGVSFEQGVLMMLETRDK